MIAPSTTRSSWARNSSNFVAAERTGGMMSAARASEPEKVGVANAPLRNVASARISDPPTRLMAIKIVVTSGTHRVRKARAPRSSAPNPATAMARKACNGSACPESD